jgi:hypothetical protein
MKKIAFIFICFYTATAYMQIDVGNNLFSGIVDTTRTVQNIMLKSRIKVPNHTIILNLGYNIPIFSNLKKDAGFWNTKAGTGVDFSVDYRKQFNTNVIENENVVSVPSWLALGAGLGFSFFHKAAAVDFFSETLSNYTDIDGDNCIVALNYKNVKESVSICYLNVPVYLEIGKLSRIKTSAFFKLGLKASILVSKKFKYEGTYSSTGYYPARDVTLHDVDRLGYFSKAECYNPLEAKLSPFVLWGFVSGGVNFPFSSLEKNKLAKWMMRINVNLDYSLTTVSKTMENTQFKNAAFHLHQSNILCAKGRRIFAPGFSLSLIYCL